jgi:putative PIN family toxin of toxin-antitoxin system
MTVVLDCNILVMCLTSKSPYNFIYKSLINNKFRLAVTVDILLEYEEIIQQKYSVSTANSLISLIMELPNVDFIHPHYKWDLIKIDQDDNKYCDCAIAGQANYIVSQDKHFDVLKTVPFPSITVVSIDSFLEILLS